MITVGVFIPVNSPETLNSRSCGVSPSQTDRLLIILLEDITEAGTLMGCLLIITPLLLPSLLTEANYAETQIAELKQNNIYVYGRLFIYPSSSQWNWREQPW